MSKSKKTPYLILWILCICGSLLIIPYLFQLGMLPKGEHLILILLAQSALIFGIVCFLSYWLVPKTDLRPFLRKGIFFPGVASGIGVGLVIYLLDKFLFTSSLLSGGHPTWWAGLLASFFGGINEEVMLRLFLFTLVYFLLRKIAKRRLLVFWITNVTVALVFGLGHLPAAFKLAAPSSIEVTRILLLNGIPGVVFGWLYWSRGLGAAMAAHFAADLVIHVIL